MRIAVADDDIVIADFIKEIAEDSGYHCSKFHNTSTIKRQLSRDTFDLLILDWNLPDGTGLELLQWLSEHVENSPPVIMLTSRADPKDIVSALQAGADDYIIKPERREIISARIEAVARRSRPEANRNRQNLVFGCYEFDRSQETVHYNGETVKLTSKEFALALTLFRNEQRPLSRAYLLENIWQSSPDITTRTVDMHISRIRSKLALKPENGFRLVTIFSYGYRLDGCDNQDAQ